MKVPTAKDEDLNLIVETHKMEAENKFLQSALYRHTCNMLWVFPDAPLAIDKAHEKLTP